MANNFAAVIERLAPVVKDALRERSGLFRWVDQDFGVSPASRGDTIPVQFASPIAVRDVAPSNVLADAPGMTPTSKTLVINQYREAPFNVTFNQILQVSDSLLEKQMQEAVRALMADLEGKLFAEAYKFAFQRVAPADFSASIAGLNAGTVILDKALAPEDDRTFVFSPDVKEALLNNTSEKQGAFNDNRDSVQDGNLGRIRGDMRAHWSQLVPSVTATRFAQAPNITGDAGATTVTAAAGTLTGTVQAGVTFTIAGIAGTYVVTADATAAANSATLSIYPGLASEATGDAATGLDGADVTFEANVLLHRSALGLVMRPEVAGPNDTIITDPISGMPIVLTIQEQHRQNYIAVSYLAGIKAIRPELLVVLEGHQA